MAEQVAAGSSPVDASAEAGTQSTVETTSVVSAVDAPQQDANPAGSSAADTQDAKGPSSPIEATRLAIEQTKAASDPSADESVKSGQQQQDQQQPAERQAEADQQQADENLPFHKHPRWQQLVADNKRLTDSAGQYDQILGFMQRSGLSHAEVAQGYQVMALMKHKPAEARKVLLDQLIHLDRRLGLVLPDDLRGDVETGRISEERARELSRTRAQSAEQEQILRHVEQQQAEQAVTVLRNDVRSAVDAREQAIASRDPDYAIKRGLIETEIKALMFGAPRPPQNPKEAVALYDTAYSRVTEQLRKTRPARPDLRPTPSTSSAKTTPVPRSALDVTRAALGLA